MYAALRHCQDPQTLSHTYTVWKIRSRSDWYAQSKFKMSSVQFNNGICIIYAFLGYYFSLYAFFFTFRKKECKTEFEIAPSDMKTLKYIYVPICYRYTIFTFTQNVEKDSTDTKKITEGTSIKGVQNFLFHKIVHYSLLQSFIYIVYGMYSLEHTLVTAPVS